MKSANDIIIEIVNMYKITAKLQSECPEDDHTMFYGYMNRKDALYQVLMSIADYNEDTVIDWINA